MATPLHPESLTWTGLLAQWVRFAQASLALPKDAQGAQWRASVPSVINLQAVTFALADLHRLDPDEQPLAIDKADMLIRQHASNLKGIWSADLPESLQEIVRDARLTLDAARAGKAAATRI